VLGGVGQRRQSPAGALTQGAGAVPGCAEGPRCYISTPNPSCGQKSPSGFSHAGENGSSTLARPPAAVEKPTDSYPEETAELIQINPNCGG